MDLQNNKRLKNCTLHLQQKYHCSTYISKEIHTQKLVRFPKIQMYWKGAYAPGISMELIIITINKIILYHNINSFSFLLSPMVEIYNIYKTQK